MSITFDKIKAITEIQATSGFERPMQDFMRQNITPHVDEVQTDGLGGIFGIKHAADTNAPRIMVAGHMDEVGFMVSKIKPDGTLRVVSLGGWNPLVISAQRFTLFARNGVEIPVITGGVPHLPIPAGPGPDARRQGGAHDLHATQPRARPERAPPAGHSIRTIHRARSPPTRTTPGGRIKPCPTSLMR